MPTNPGHELGECIGAFLEGAVKPRLAKVARAHGLYLDSKGRRAARAGASVVWHDAFGNVHDLDFVMEADGSDHTVGRPVAFIETAWRRYTKHSRNKAQEMQGALLPIAERFSDTRPFLGVIAAGNWTGNALAQLRSVGFCVVHIPAATLEASLLAVAVDVSSDEGTPRAALETKVAAFKALDLPSRARASRRLLALCKSDIDAFVSTLERALSRRVERVTVIPVFGTAHEFPSVSEAVAFVETYAPVATASALVRYEITVRFVNGDRVEGAFADRTEAVGFLRRIYPPQ